jgi:hypothetical protein
VSWQDFTEEHIQNFMRHAREGMHPAAISGFSLPRECHLWAKRSFAIIKNPARQVFLAWDLLMNG